VVNTWIGNRLRTPRAVCISFEAWSWPLTSV